METRKPPRYVPTLTRVIEPKPSVGSDAGENMTDAFAKKIIEKAASTPNNHAAEPSTSVPFGANTEPAAQATPASTQDAPPVIPSHIAKRVMKRVDLSIDRHVREATTQVALEFSKQIAEKMRPQIELAIQNAVQEALKIELQNLK